MRPLRRRHPSGPAPPRQAGTSQHPDDQHHQQRIERHAAADQHDRPVAPDRRLGKAGGLIQQVRPRIGHEIALREHRPDPAHRVHHGQPAEPLVRHDPQPVDDVVGLPRHARLGRHDVGQPRRRRIASGMDDLRHDVALGDDALDAVVAVHHHHRAIALVGHRRHRLGHRCLPPHRQRLRLAGVFGPVAQLRHRPRAGFHPCHRGSSFGFTGWNLWHPGRGQIISPGYSKGGRMGFQARFDNSYARLPARFYHRQPAEPVRAPALGLDPEALRSEAGVAVLAGNALPDGADPLAQAYAGHQFGGWNPQLGDGRALLIGEVVDRHGRRRDIQPKGSGRTPFSRMGDGRAWIGPVLREYIVSEAMHAMGVPTTRALAAVTTGERVLRERVLPGAVLTRVASSHVRVGTFQYFAARGDEEAVRLLSEHVIARHYPDATGALDLLTAVVAAQARLVARWMATGFIHGVMNTDNCAISGETIDYGPCAFMDAYSAGKVFSSIDVGGRYAYGNQPRIAAWNLAQFATCLLPLIDEDADAAVEQATEAVHTFPPVYEAAWLAAFRAKLGLTTEETEDAELITDLLGR